MTGSIESTDNEPSHGLQSPPRRTTVRARHRRLGDRDVELELPAGEYTLTADASGFAASSPSPSPSAAAKRQPPTSTRRRTGSRQRHRTMTTRARSSRRCPDYGARRRHRGPTVYTRTTPAGTASSSSARNDTLVFNHGTGYTPAGRRERLGDARRIGQRQRDVHRGTRPERTQLGRHRPPRPQQRASTARRPSTTSSPSRNRRARRGVHLRPQRHRRLGLDGVTAAERDIMFIRIEEITTGGPGTSTRPGRRGDGRLRRDPRGVHRGVPQPTNATVFQINAPGDRFVSLDSAPGQHEEYLPMVDAIEAYNGPYGESDAASVQGLFTLGTTATTSPRPGSATTTVRSASRRNTGAPAPGHTSRGLSRPRSGPVRERRAHVRDVRSGRRVHRRGQDAWRDRDTTAGSSVEASATSGTSTNWPTPRSFGTARPSNVTLDGTNDTVSTDVDIDGNAWVASVRRRRRRPSADEPVGFRPVSKPNPGLTATASPAEPRRLPRQTPRASQQLRRWMTLRPRSQDDRRVRTRVTAVVTLLALIGAALLATRRRT